MEASPEPTVIARTLKDFNQFLLSGSKTRECYLASYKRLSFSDAVSDTSSLADDDSRTGVQWSRKRNLESLAGFDITKKFREKDGEIISGQATIKRLEGRLQELDMSTKKAILERDTELEGLRRKQLRDKELIDDLHHKIKLLHSREREAQETSNKVKKECNTTSFETEAKMIKMQQEHLEQCNRLHEELSGLQKKLLNMEKEVDEKSSKVELSESHAKELEKKLTEVQSKLRESGASQLQSETQKFELDQAKAKIKEFELQQKELKMLEKKADVFEATVRKLSGLEKELSKLKEENKFFRDTERNTKLIEERLAGAQQQLKLMEKRCQENAHFQAENDLFKETLQQYEAIIRKEFGLDHKATPQELQYHITKLKEGDQSLTNGIAQLQASQQSLEDRRALEEAEIKLLKAKLENQQRNTLQNAQLIKRLQRKLTLVAKERDGLKSILSSYESEITINHSVVSQEKIGKLENQLDLYKMEVQRLESELESSHGINTNEAPPFQQRQEDAEKISYLENKVLQLQAEISKLFQAKEVLELRLESRALKGDYDPTKTKVLHFENNPLVKAIENRGTEIQRLQTENEALRDRVRLLEQGEECNITQRSGIKVSNEAPSSKELSELQEKIKSIETRNKRLLEAFKRKSLDMRETVYQLTGYRVDASGDNKYKLINMYADSADDYFLFEQTPAKELQLLETEFSSSLEDLIDAYLRRENSYPAFLSAVTLDLFNRQTVEQPASSSDAEEEEEEGEEDEEEEEEEDDREMEVEVEDPLRVLRQEENDDDDDDEDELVILD